MGFLHDGFMYCLEITVKLISEHYLQIREYVFELYVALVTTIIVIILT